MESHIGYNLEDKESLIYIRTESKTEGDFTYKGSLLLIAAFLKKIRSPFSVSVWKFSGITTICFSVTSLVHVRDKHNNLLCNTTTSDSMHQHCPDMWHANKNLLC